MHTTDTRCTSPTGVHREQTGTCSRCGQPVLTLDERRAADKARAHAHRATLTPAHNAAMTAAWEAIR